MRKVVLGLECRRVLCSEYLGATLTTHGSPRRAARHPSHKTCSPRAHVFRWRSRLGGSGRPLLPRDKLVSTVMPSRSILPLVIWAAAAGAQSNRPVTVADMIRMTKISGDEPWSGGVVRPAVFSNDGRRF